MAIVKEKSREECQGDAKILTRSEWGAAAERSDADPLPTTDCVILDGSSYSFRGKNYTNKMKTTQELENFLYGSFLKNFLIADDGVVYEALGWDNIYFLAGGGLKCLRIGFIKPTTDVAPSTAAVNAFNSLLKTAICLEKLSPSYRIIPYHFINDDNVLDTNSFERNELLKWDRCERNTDLTKKDYEYGSFPIIFREDWDGKEFINTVYNRMNKIKFVMVGNYDERCFTTESCIRTMKLVQQFFNKYDRDFKENFLIGDDGFVYEVFGWNQTWEQYWVDKETILVKFRGRFNYYLPSERAMKAFSRLLRLGVLWGYLSPEYKIVSYTLKNDDVKYIGDSLDAAVRKMERFSDNFESHDIL